MFLMFYHCYLKDAQGFPNDMNIDTLILTLHGILKFSYITILDLKLSGLFSSSIISQI